MPKYGFADDDWSTAKGEMRDILIERARVRGMIPYSELVEGVETIRFEPFSAAFHHMLGEISSEEDAEGRGMLSAIVVHKDGDMEPGPGFFELASQLDRDTSDILRCWVNEIHRVHGYWNDN